jgi:hypothetical protein
MKQPDDLSAYYEEHLEGRYDCVDRIVLNGYFPLGQQGGAFRTWWRALTGSDANLDADHLMQMAGRFSRRVHAWAKEHAIPLIHCPPDQRKHELAETYLPADPQFRGLFLILVAKAPALVWEVTTCKSGAPHLERKKPWPYVNHYHFHLIDPEWGHLTIKMSGHPPFGVQIMLNGHEWVERQARAQAISLEKEGNCFVGGSFQALDQLADTLCDEHAIGRLAKVCDRWVYSSCLCFALTIEEQERSRFRYRYSVYQIEYSRNLLFVRGTTLDAVFQGLIDRTRRLLDVPILRTLFGRKQRPRWHTDRSHGVARIVDQSAYDLTVFKVHFGALTLKLYDKGARVLRAEAIAHNTKELRCGRSLEKLSIMLAKLQHMAIDFLNAMQAAHVSFLPDGVLDSLIEPTERGNRRLSGVDLQKPRMRSVAEAILHLAPNPDGFTVQELADEVRPSLPEVSRDAYTGRQAAYDLMKLRGKCLIERIAKTRRYRPRPTGISILAGWLILREKVIKPVLAGAGTPHLGPPPKNIQALDQHYENLQRELRRTFDTLLITVAPGPNTNTNMFVSTPA